jgi:DNA-binding FadR family transcriptional regulator
MDAGVPTRTARGTGRRLRGSIAHRLGVAILSGELKPGEVLPNEVAIAEDMDVSRGAVREAIQALTAKGLVESRPKTGTRVLPRNRWNLLDPMVLSWAFSGTPDERFVHSLFELRRIIEPAAAELAAQRRSGADLEAMATALAAMEEHTLGSEEGQLADRDFHGAILEATGNDALVTLIASVGAAVNWTTRFKQRARALPRNPIPEHLTVYEAIRDQDVAAAGQRMRDLIDLALEDTRASMDR